MAGAFQMIAPLSPDLAAQLDRDGYLLLRGAVPLNQREILQHLFDAGITTDWPVPRGDDWAHAAIDLEPAMRSTCLLPQVLAAGWHILQTSFFFSQVEGREPRPGGGAQPLHRDVEAGGEHVAILVFLDDYGPANGATRVAPGTHKGGSEAGAMILCGQAGDILVFDAALLHGATCNTAGARRRSLLGGYAPERLRADLARTQTARNVRMDVSETFSA